MRTWFAVDNSLVDRNDLTAYEKLCGMVLARYAGRPEFDHLLTTDIIAVKMGVSAELALGALRGLVRKGLIDVESTSELFVEGSTNHIRNIELSELEDKHVIKRTQISEEPEPVRFESLDFETGADSELVSTPEPDQEPLRLEKEAEDAVADSAEDNVVAESDEARKAILNRSIHEQSESVRAWIEQSEEIAPKIAPKTPELNREALVSEVLEFVEEPINDRQARIILGLAQYDMNKVKRCYAIAKGSQLSDKIDVLIHELQKEESVQAPKRQPQTSQVDHMRLNQMKKYQAMKNPKV